MSSNLYKSVEYIPVARTVGKKVLDILKGAAGNQADYVEMEAGEDTITESDHREGSIDSNGIKDAKPESSAMDKTRFTEEDLTRAVREAEEHGYKRGLSDNVAALKDDALADLGRDVALLADLISELEKTRMKIANEKTESVVELAMALSRKITRAELSIKPTLIRNSVSEVIRRFVSSDKVVLRMNPEDVCLIRSIEKELSSTGFEFLEDPGISRGGFKVELERGTIDATLETVEKELHSFIEDMYGRVTDDD